MTVDLPVSDAQWFSGRRLNSVPLGPDPLYAWKVLHNSLNQNERAWYLASKAILKSAQESQSTSLGSPEREKVRTALACFQLALPPSFDRGRLIFVSENASQVDWIINTSYTRDVGIRA